METKKEYILLDFPKIKNKYRASSPGKVAEKIFNKLIKHLKFSHNMNGELYLVFHIKDLQTKKILPFIGTVIYLKNHINFKKQKKNIEIDHRIIVSKFDSNMKKVFHKIES